MKVAQVPVALCCLVLGFFLRAGATHTGGLEEEHVPQRLRGWDSRPGYYKRVVDPPVDFYDYMPSEGGGVGFEPTFEARRRRNKARRERLESQPYLGDGETYLTCELPWCLDHRESCF